MSVSISGEGSIIGVDQGINVVGLTTLSGGLQIDDSIVHTGDDNTKIRFPTDDTVTVETAGSERLRITSAGNIGIGEDSPDSLLHIGKGTNTDDGVVTFTIGGSVVNTRQSTITKNNVGSGDRALEIRAATGNSDETIKFFSDSTTERLRITSAGLVGIGTDNPIGRLHVNGSGNDDSRITITTPTRTLTRIGYYGLEKFGIDMQDGFQIRDASDSYATRLLIDDSGNIGIGEASPTMPLMVKSERSGGKNIFDLNNQIANHYGGLRVTLGETDRECRLTATYGASMMTFYTSASTGSPTERMRISSTGGITWANSDAILESFNSYSDARIRGSASGVNIYVQSYGQTGVIQSGSGWISASSIRIKNVVDNVDPNQCWEFVKNISLKRYYYKDQPQEGVTYLGPIAEEISALDSEMSIMTNQEDSEGKIPSYNEPLMHMKALAALQIALVRIETLEVEVQALKGS